MDRRKFLKAGTAAAASVLAMPAVLRAAEAKHKFKLHHFLGPKSPAQVKMLEPWAKRVEDASKGQVKIDIYPSMSLGGKPPQLIRQVRDGVVDLVWTVNGYTAGLFPRSEAFELPFVHTNNPVATNLAMKDMYDKHLAPEYGGVQVMWLHVHAGQAFHMVDTPVHKPEDLKGKKMRIPSRTGAWILESLGAIPVGMPVPDLPQALSKKVVDGAMVPWEIIPPLKLQELTKYQIEGQHRTRFGTTTFQVSMNEKRWKGLPKDIQKAFSDNSGEAWWKEVGEIWAANEVPGIELAVKHGNKHIELTKDELDAFHKATEPVVDKWVKDVSPKGVKAKELVAEARKMIAKYDAKYPVKY